MDREYTADIRWKEACIPADIVSILLHCETIVEGRGLFQSQGMD
jgi:hypothetical protein